MDFRNLGIDFKWMASKQTPSRFSFSTNDFNKDNLKYKETIKHIFYANWFPKINEKNATINASFINKDSLNSCIQAFKASEEPGKFKLLYNYDLRGLGPGEVLLYLIVNGSYLGGGSSAASDLIVGSSTYEIKSSKKNIGENFYYDFRFGKTIDDHEIKEEILKLGKKYNLIKQSTQNNTSLVITPNQMKEIANLEKEEFKNIEKKYCDIVKKYLGNTSLIIFDRNDGLIKYLEQGKLIKQSAVGIYRVASGTIEPLIRA